MPALNVVDGDEQGDRRLAEQILEEFDSQPATCRICGDTTFRGGLEEMEMEDDE